MPRTMHDGLTDTSLPASPVTSLSDLKYLAKYTLEPVLYYISSLSPFWFQQGSGSIKIYKSFSAEAWGTGTLENGGTVASELGVIEASRSGSVRLGEGVWFVTLGKANTI